MGLIFTLLYSGVRHFVPRRAFLLTAAAPMLASWFYRSLSLFSFVYSILYCCIGDDLRYVHYGFDARLRQVQC